MAFARFMAGPIGRLARIAVGLILIVVGLFSVTGIGGLILAVIGAVFVAVGVLNVCLIAPLIGAPFSGKDALST